MHALPARSAGSPRRPAPRAGEQGDAGPGRGLAGARRTSPTGTRRVVPPPSSAGSAGPAGGTCRSGTRCTGSRSVQHRTEHPERRRDRVQAARRDLLEKQRRLTSGCAPDRLHSRGQGCGADSRGVPIQDRASCAARWRPMVPSAGHPGPCSSATRASTARDSIVAGHGSAAAPPFGSARARRTRRYLRDALRAEESDSFARIPARVLMVVPQATALRLRQIVRERTTSGLPHDQVKV